jgi:succinate dehydrogenase / fumarate reductase cytochrome b subunit
MSQNKLKAARPLSPHIQIYSPMLTMMMSIMHRLTGIGLYFGILIFTWWLMAAASGPEYFNYVNGLLDTVLGKLVLLLATWGLFHHMFGGIRHFIWDFTKGFELATVETMARIGLIVPILITGALWFMLCS